MAPDDCVVDISSDEEELPTGNKLPVEHLECLSDLFDVDVATMDDWDDLMVMSDLSSQPVLQKTTKSDDLVVISELSSPPVHQKKARSVGGRGEKRDNGFEDLSDDDECMVLDGDPDKAVAVDKEEGSVGDSSSDELQIVAEKGPLACRDFPHSRHLCSNFPFNSTSHAKYCKMCHCFVCDSPSPCEYWGNGTSVTEHCHATDKEGRWKELRQAFKRKCLPASGPEKHQSLPCSTIMSPRQQNMHFEVAVPQSLSSSASIMGHHSLANQVPLLQDTSQNRQRNPTFRVSLSLTGTIATPRAGRGSPHISQNTQSRAIFKRAGSFPPNATRFSSAATPDNSLMNQALPDVSHPVQVAPRSRLPGTAQDNAPLRSLSAPIAFQEQQNQPAAYGQVAPNGKNFTIPQLSRCTSFSAQRTQCVEEPVFDVSTKSWEDILACMTSDLGVSDYSISTAESQHVTTNPGAVHLTASQGLGFQHEPVVATNSFASSHVHDLQNHSTSGNVQVDDFTRTTESMAHLNCQSSIVHNESHANNFAGGLADDLAKETAAHLEISTLESILFEFNCD